MKLIFLAWSVAVSVHLMTGCVQMPTERQAAVDLRPRISFAVANPALDPAQLYVSVDGLAMGVVSSFMVGQQELTVLPGSHVVRVTLGDRIVMEERVYVGDGMTKTLLVN